MALKKRGKWWYGDSQADIRDELVRLGKLNECVPTLEERVPRLSQVTREDLGH